MNRIHLFETEIGPSKALTIINQVLAGTGVIILIAVPFAYWIQIASMPVNEFDMCGVYSGPPLEEKALILLCYNIFGAFVGMLFYVTENIEGKFTHQKKKQEKKPMKVTLWRESNPLSKVKVAAPCPAQWRFMYGNQRVRFCNQCQLNVYNLSAMTKVEAESLIQNAEGRLCINFYRRADGTILTQNCPVGLRAIREKFNRTRTHILGALLSIMGCFGFVGSYKFAARVQKQGGLFPPYQKEVIGLMIGPSHKTIIQKDESFIREKAMFKVSPVYHATGSHRINGVVIVKLVISETGEVEHAELVKGNPLFKKVAEEAASRWKFEPVQSEDLPVKVESQLTFRFR